MARDQGESPRLVAKGTCSLGSTPLQHELSPESRYNAMQGMDNEQDDSVNAAHELEMLNNLLSERFGSTTTTGGEDFQVSVKPRETGSDGQDDYEPTAFPLFAATRPSKPTNKENEGDVKILGKRKRQHSTSSRLLLVRLLSPEPVYNGPGKGRVLDVEDEEPEVTNLRCAQIAEVTVSASYILETSSPQYWSLHHADGRNVISRQVLASQSTKKDPLPVLARLTSSLQPAAPITSRIPSRTHKLRVSAYPRQDVVRLGTRLKKKQKDTNKTVEPLPSAPAIWPSISETETKRNDTTIKDGGVRDEAIAPTGEEVSVIVGKKKKAGKSERKRMKAAKEKEEKEAEEAKQEAEKIKELERIKKRATAAALAAERAAGNGSRKAQEGKQDVKMKRKSKRRRMYEKASKANDGNQAVELAKNQALKEPTQKMAETAGPDQGRKLKRATEESDGDYDAEMAVFQTYLKDRQEMLLKEEEAKASKRSSKAARKSGRADRAARKIRRQVPNASRYDSDSEFMGWVAERTCPG